MTEDVPQWALDRVAALCLVTRDQIATFQWLRIFARYIAEHEEPPVDPLEEIITVERNKIVEECVYTYDGLRTAVNRALRRGIELGKESK
jgi:hypothetical protein